MDELARKEGRLHELLSLLRVAEATTTGEPSALIRLWSEVDTESLDDANPLLVALVAAKAEERAPELGPSVEQLVDQLDPPQRAVFDRLHPRRPHGSGYRAPATTQLVKASSAPVALAALARRTPPPPGWVPAGIQRWLLIPAPLFLFVAAFDLPVFLLIAACYVPWAAGWLTHRTRRLRGLRDAGITDGARLRELAAMCSRSSDPSVAPRSAFPLEHNEVMVVLGLAQAERALRAGDRAEARASIGWWLEGIAPDTLRQLDMTAIASSALRVAILLGYDDAAQAIDARIGVHAGSRMQSGHGAAPRAIHFARALRKLSEGKILCSHRGRPPRGYRPAPRNSPVEKQLQAAAAARPVVLDEFETELYGFVLRRYVDAGGTLPKRLEPLLGPKNPPAWLAAWARNL